MPKKSREKMLANGKDEQPIELQNRVDLDGELKEHSGPKRVGNPLSRLTFWPATSIITAGAKKPIKHHQLWKVDEHCRAHTTWKKVKRLWKEELEIQRKGGQPSLFRAIRRAFFGEWLVTFFLLVIYGAMGFVSPVLLPRLINYIYAAKIPPEVLQNVGDNLPPALEGVADVKDWHGYVYVAAIFLATIIGSFCNYHAQIRCYILGIKVRSAFTMLIYRKSLYVRSSKSHTTGHIANLIANDAQFILDTFPIFNAGFIAPLQIIASVILIGLQLGWYCIIPIVLLILTSPYNGYMGKKTGEYRFKQQRATDIRVKFMKEFVSAMRIVKYYAWEVPFRRNIDANREEELKRVRQSLGVRAKMMVVLINVPAVGIGLTFTLYGIWNELNVSTVFTSLSLLNLLRGPFIVFPLLISFGLQYRVTFDRIQEFLVEPELPKRPKEDNKPGKHAIVFENASFSYTPEDPNAPLAVKNVNLKIKKGEMVMVVGKVGSGKSTLVQAAINEVPVVSGSVHTYGSVAYVPQEAWIINATVRDNITFGKPYDEKLFDTVARVCALKPDFELMPAGELTEIGERGVNLSGGQRQRISIARALYADRDVYILDDILSAVDSGVAQHLAKEAIEGYLKKRGKTILFVTNQLQFLPMADKVIFMDDGEIAEYGTFEELKSAGKKFASLIKDFGLIDNTKSKKNKLDKRAGSSDAVIPAVSVKAKPSEIKMREELEKQKKGILIRSEESESGNIDSRIYFKYITFGGILLFMSIIFITLLRVTLRTYSYLWLSYWSQDFEGNPERVESNPKHIWITLFITAVFGEVFAHGCALVLQIYWTVRASRTISTRLMNKLERATIAWFDATPIGRILTRFTKDLQLIDTQLPQTLDQTLNFLSNLIGIFAQLAIGNLYLLIVIAVVIVIYTILLSYFRKTSIEIQRLEAISRAPIISHLTQTLEGASTIRSFGLEKAFRVANMNKIDSNTVDYFGLRYCFAWFGLRLDWCGTAMILATYLAVVLTRNFAPPENLDAAFAALAMSSTAPITFLMAAFSQNFIELETRMNSVERLLQYDAIPQEPPAHIESTAPPASWPQKGAIEFKGLSISYNGTDKVLKKITTKIKPREKVGIVGRTGSGKSTLVTALFRLMEFAEGTILIDGVDISKIGLNDLRTKISIIPQTPTLFMGTVRYNVDPFNEYNDADVWRVLEMVQLKDYVSNLEGQLDHQVEENGQNFSVGQRQLLAMARALLRDAPILVLDEATAATDAASDQIIQRVIRKYFAKKTILTIAHRLNTIMDSDRVLVLDKGELVEFDKPSVLLQNPKGIFTRMVEATGPASAAYLRRIANGELSVLDAIPEEVIEESNEIEQSKPTLIEK